MKNKIKYEPIYTYVKSKFPQEACGVLIVKRGRIKFIPCENTSLDPLNNFSINSQEFADAEDQGEVVAIVHSHTKAPYAPSQGDVISQKVHGYPWLVVATDGQEILQTNWLENEKQEFDLYGRPFIWHIFDCYTFIRDWYKQEMNIQIPEIQYKANFWEYGEELYLDNFKQAGFEEVHLESIQYGDAILMDLCNGVTSHAAIYLGGNTIAHHINGRLSSRDIYGQFYMGRTTKVVRYKNAKNN